MHEAAQGNAIRNTRAAFHLELRLRHFLSGRVRLDSALSRTAVRLEEWADSAVSAGVEAGLLAFAGLEIHGQALQLIRAIAEYFTDDVRGTERDLLLKSLQETLYYSTGASPELTRSEFVSRLQRFLARRGTLGLLRRFLSLHFFNVVWFHTSERLRARASSSESLLKDMEQVERRVRQIVNSAWRDQKLERPLKAPLARQFISKVGQRLSG
jgi:hypothetical protein